jgi:hypothetical protein
MAAKNEIKFLIYYSGTKPYSSETF